MKKLTYFITAFVCAAIILYTGVASAAAVTTTEVTVTAEKSAVPAILTILGGVLLFIAAAVSAYRMISKHKK